MALRSRLHCPVHNPYHAVGVRCGLEAVKSIESTVDLTISGDSDQGYYGVVKLCSQKQGLYVMMQSFCSSVCLSIT